MILWADISRIASNVQGMPWVLLGDFNVVRFPMEKMDGDISLPPYMEDFNDCCRDAQIDDLKYTGLHMT